MKKRFWIPMITLPLAMAALVTSSEAQGKGKEQGAEKAGQSQRQGKGKPEKAPVPAPSSRAASTAQQRGRPGVAADLNRGRAVSRFTRDLRVSEVRPAVRRFVTSKRAAEFVTGGAVAYAFARGAPESALLIAPTGRDVSVRNRKGDLLVTLDDNRARTLGEWQVSPLNDRVTGGAPSFCRSGQGHPVWGRQWCLDKGFGLGTQQNVRWGTTRGLGDLVFVRQATLGTLTRDALLNLLGPVAFNRLALHAVTLGYTDPLTGAWHSEASGSNLLRVNSGRWPVAELVDTNRDQRADLMLVALRPW